VIGEQRAEVVAVPEDRLVDPAITILSFGQRGRPFPADELGGGLQLQPIHNQVDVGLLEQPDRGRRVSADKFVEDRLYRVVIRPAQKMQVPVHLLVEVGCKQLILGLGETGAQCQDRVRKRRPCRYDADMKGVFEAGEIVTHTHRAQPATNAIGLGLCPVQVDIDAILPRVSAFAIASAYAVARHQSPQPIDQSG
jgi:hypothetical protein